MKKAYLGGPIAGLDYSGAVDWRVAMTLNLAAWGVEGLSPMRAKEFLRDELDLDSRVYSHPLSTPKGITTRDRNDVRNCDVVIFNLLGATRVSIGTMMEVAWADAYGKPKVVVMEQSGNIHEHPILSELSDFRVETLTDALLITRAILNV